MVEFVFEYVLCKDEYTGKEKLVRLDDAIDDYGVECTAEKCSHIVMTIRVEARTAKEARKKMIDWIRQILEDEGVKP